MEPPAWGPPLTPVKGVPTKGWLIVTTALAPTLTAADRCDRCGAQAFIRARLSGDQELLFCAHHGREHLDKLRAIAEEVIDESDRLHEEQAATI